MVRIKSRYIICQILFDSSLSNTNNTNTNNEITLHIKEILQCIQDKIINLFGEIGLGNIYLPLQIKFYDNYSKILIIRIPRDMLTNCWYSLSCINEIKNNNCIIRCLNICSSDRTYINDIKVILNNFIINKPNLTQNEINNKLNDYNELIKNIT